MNQDPEVVAPLDVAEITIARLRAELAMRDVQILQLKTFVRLGLGEHDSFDLETGRIVRVEHGSE